MTLELALTLLGLLLMTVGSIFYIIAMLMQRHCERKLWELEQKQKGEINERL
jgi:hypothetical protein